MCLTRFAGHFFSYLLQDACKELGQEYTVYIEVDHEDHATREISLKEFIEDLREPKFQVLDTEFELSKKLPLVCSFIPYALAPCFITIIIIIKTWSKIDCLPLTKCISL